MTQDPQTIPLEELLAHAAWVQNLARSLLFDQDQVDDVVQETWVLALRRGPRDPARARAWLAGLLRNVVRNRVRGEGRRARRERAVARDEQAPPADDLVAHAELQRRVVDAVLALEEPYRSTVLMRWFDDLRPAEIARRLGVPDATVRARCRRALAKLREALDEETGGDRRAWSLAMVPWALPGVARKGSLGGALLVSTSLKTGLGVLVAVAAVGTWWWMGEESAAPVVAAPIGPAGAASVDASLTPTPPVAVHADAAEPAPLVPPAAPPPTAEEASGAPPPFVLAGRVVDSAGRPVPDARVGHAPRWELVPARSPGAPRPDGPPERAWTDADAGGRFVLRATPAPVEAGASVRGTDTLLLHADGFEWTAVALDLPTDVERHDLGDLVLQPAGVVTGRVVDDRGDPVAGARLASPAHMLYGPFGRFDEWIVVRPYLEAESDTDGVFRLPSLWPVDQSFDVTRRGFAPGRFDVEPVAERTTDVGDVLLSRGEAIRGRVVDVDGRPVAGLDVLARVARLDDRFTGEGAARQHLATRIGTTRGGVTTSSAESWTRTHEDGAFLVEALVEDAYTVVVGGDGWEPALARGVAPGSAPVELVVEAPSTLVVRAVDAESGAPVTDAVVRAHRRGGTGTVGLLPWLPVERGTGDDEGASVVRGAGASGTGLVVSAPGFVVRTDDAPGVPAAGRGEHVVALSRGGAVHGSVRDAAGDAVHGAWVGARRVAPVGGPDLPDDLTRELPDPDAAEATTGADGSFRLDGLAPGGWVLVARDEAGGVASAPESFTVHGAEVVTLDPVLGTGGSLHGVLVDGDGAPVADEPVSLRGAGVGPTPARHRRTGAVRHAIHDGGVGSDRLETDAAGRFRFLGLAAGDYVLRVSPGDPLEVALAHGEDREVRLVRRERPRLAGVVTDAEGPVVGAEVRVHRVADGALRDVSALVHGLRTDGHGRYEGRPDPGDHVVAAVHDGAWSAPREVTLSWDATTVLDLGFGDASVAGVVLDEERGRPLHGATVTLRDSTRAPAWEHLPGPAAFTRRVTTDEAGRFTIDRLLDGPHALDVVAEGREPAGPTVVEVRRGAEPLVVRLPRAVDDGR